MAIAANKDSVNENERTTNVDWAAALEKIQTTIHGLESEQRSLSADAKDAWETIENLGVNKVGAQLFSKVLKKPVEKRRDEFRTFINLAKAAGWFDWFRDLVDKAEAPTPEEQPTAAPAPPRAAPAPPTPAPPADDSDLAGEEPRPTRINLKSGWLQRLKEGVEFHQEDTKDEEWEDVRQATPDEMAKARDALADFDDRRPDAAPKVEPEVEAAKGAARKKAPAKK